MPFVRPVGLDEHVHDEEEGGQGGEDRRGHESPNQSDGESERQDHAGLAHTKTP